MKIKTYSLTAVETEELALALSRGNNWVPPSSSRVHRLFYDTTNYTAKELFDYMDRTIVGWRWRAGYDGC